MTLMRPALLVLAPAFVAACGGVTAVRSVDGGTAGDASVVDGAAGGPSVCKPGSVQSCYDGPAATEGVGPCHGGTKSCKPDGSGFGPCTGEVLPKTEDCSTPIDEDCDGHTTCGQLLWTKTFGDGTPSHDSPYYPMGVWGERVATDAAGNIVVTGGFQGTVDFGSGTLDAGSGKAMFVAKLDASGSGLWSRSFPMVVASDSFIAPKPGIEPDGSIVLSGVFSGSVDFGKGALQSATTSLYLARLAADGKTLWSKSVGPGKILGADFAVDSSGNIVTSGSFSGTLDFGGAPVSSGSTGSGAMYLAKLAPDGIGIWAKTLPLPGGVGQPGVLAGLDKQFCLIGTTSGVDFSTGADTDPNSFVVRQEDPDGKALWTLLASDLWAGGTPYQDVLSYSSSDLKAAVDMAGDVLVAGYASPFGASVFKLDSSGNLLWGVVGGQSDGQISDAAADKFGNLLVVGDEGKFGYQLDTGVGFGCGYDLSGVTRGFVAKVSALGDAEVWCRDSGPNSDAVVYGVAITPDNNIVVVGDFTQADFGNGPLPHVGTASNGFIAEFGP